MPITYDNIATTTLGSAASSITFSSISSAYTDLRVVLVCTSNTSFVYPEMQFNGDTGTNYSWTWLYGNGSSASSSRSPNVSSIVIASNNVGASTTVPLFGTIDIFSYAGSTNKTCLTTGSIDANGSGEAGRFVGMWRNTAAITSIRLFTASNSFATGTTATLYGIKNA